MDDAAGENGPARSLVEVARAFAVRHWAVLAALAAAVCAPLFYLATATASLTVAVLGTSLLAYLAAWGVALEINPVTRFVTWQRRLEAAGGRAFTAFLAYLPIGYATLALLTWFSPRDFPLFDQAVLRYVIIWPFYLFFVLFCQVSGLPCPPPPGAGAAAGG